MIAISNDFKNAMKQPIKEIDAYINGSVTLNSAGDLISFKISCDSGMCKSAMRKLEAKYLGEHNLLGQWVHVGYGVKLPNGTFEYLDYGSFLVTEITTVKDTGVTTIVGYDKMVSSMREYTKLEAEYPIKLIDYTRLLCEACGLELGNDIFGKNLLNEKTEGKTNRWFYKTNGFTAKAGVTYTLSCDTRCAGIYVNRKDDNTNVAYIYEKTALTFTLTEDTLVWFDFYYPTTYEMSTIFQLEENNVATPYVPYNQMNDWEITQELWENINGITYRDILVQIAQATSTTCIISNDDKVYFKPLSETGEQLTYSNMLKLKLEPMYGEINSVVLARTPQEDNIFMRDEESVRDNGLTEYKIENNEIIDKDRDNAMTPIYEALHGISYYPFETTTEGLGWYEIADSFDIINDTGDRFNTSLFNYSITIDGAVKEILKTVADTKTQTQYQYATTIAKRVKNTEIVVDKQGQQISSLVSDMYAEDGKLNENFTQIYQDIHNIINSVQNSGGNNLIKNSVMFAYDTDKRPNDWDIKHGGKNKLNAPFTETNKLTHTATRDDHYEVSNYYATLEAGKTYTFSAETDGVYGGNGDTVEFYLMKDKAYDSILNIRKNNHTFSVDISGNYYLRYDVNLAGATHSFWNIQIEEGETATPFKLYNEGQIIIDSNVESLTAGGLSGHSFTLLDKKATQKVAVSTDTQYTFSTKIKKATTGSCYVKLYNTNEEYIIEVPVGENVFYKDYELKGLQPKDNYYIVEFYGSADSGATFTDNMLAVGNYKSPWQQANGEVMNTQVNVNLEGVLVKSSIYLGDYTVMSPLEFAGYSNINGTITKVFSLNKDVTLVKKLEAEDEVKMVPIKIVPITTGDIQGWAFVPST